MEFRYEQDDVFAIEPILADSGIWHTMVMFSDGAVYCGHNDVNLTELQMMAVPVVDEMGYGIFIPAPEILN